MSCLKPLYLLPLLATTAFAAEPAPAPWRFGFSVQTALPLGDLKTDTGNHLGGGVSALATYRLRPEHALRLRMDIDFFRVRDREASGVDRHEHTDFARFGGGVDYLFYPQGDQGRGWFLSAGLGVTRWQLEDQRWEHRGTVTYKAQETTRNRTGLGVAAGVGFQFTRVVAVEVRATSSPYDRPAQGSLTTGDTAGGSTQGLMVQLAASFRW